MSSRQPTRTLSELVASLRGYERILVTGPQRSGTNIASNILASELDYRFIPEADVGVVDLARLFELYRVGRRIVVHGPGFSSSAHLLPGAVVMMRRPVEEIVRSQARIRWNREQEELGRYFTTQGPIAKVKYAAWDQFQKAQLQERAFELDYHSLRGHALWVDDQQRQRFSPRQTRPTVVDAHADTVARLQRVLRAKPRDPETYYNLGRALARQTRHVEATLCYQQAVRLRPDFADAHKRLGDSIRARRGTTVDEAVASYREAIRLDPSHAEAHHMLGRTLKDLGLLDEAVATLRRACELAPDSADIHSSLLYCLHYHPDTDPGMLVREHAEWNARHAEPLAPRIESHDNDPDPERRLRIGYVSPYFRKHPVGRFLWPLVADRDRTMFEIFCYASVHLPDDLTARFRTLADCWRDTTGMSDAEVANLVRKDRIDILVELDAHTAFNRLLTFARRPAPVQVSYLAYCSTTGMRAMDYRLTDPYLDVPGQTPSYAEKSVWLPETYWCYQPHIDLPPVGALPAQTRGYVTFGSLNNFWKVTTPTLAAWRELLQTVSGSRLLLHARPGSHRDRVRTFFAEAAVDPDRIEFVGVTEQAEYFERYGEIDIGLDPFPYGGGTTTCDALWMGVPVITLVGATPVSRAGSSILSNVGLPQLIARTPAEYVSLAAGLAADLPGLVALRAGMRERLLHSPLTDAPRFTAHVEAAFRTMWRQWCAKTVEPHAVP